MTPGRLRALIAQAPHASERRARRLYEELYGAQVGSSVTLERVRAAIIEAANELLERPQKGRKP